jgi:hypothetical protein
MGILNDDNGGLRKLLFSRLLQELQNRKARDDVQVAAVQLFNVMLCTLDDLRDRMVVRSALYHSGIVSAIQVCVTCECAGACVAGRAR